MMKFKLWFVELELSGDGCFSALLICLVMCIAATITLGVGYNNYVYQKTVSHAIESGYSVKYDDRGRVIFSGDNK